MFHSIQYVNGPLLSPGEKATHIQPNVTSIVQWTCVVDGACQTKNYVNYQAVVKATEREGKGLWVQSQKEFIWCLTFSTLGPPISNTDFLGMQKSHVFSVLLYPDSHNSMESLSLARSHSRHLLTRLRQANTSSQNLLSEGEGPRHNEVNGKTPLILMGPWFHPDSLTQTMFCFYWNSTRIPFGIGFPSH